MESGNKVHVTMCKQEMSKGKNGSASGGCDESRLLRYGFVCLALEQWEVDPLKDLLLSESKWKESKMSKDVAFS